MPGQNKFQNSIDTPSNHSTKSVRFCDVIRFSDHRIGYLEYEDDDILSACSSHDEWGEDESRWSQKAQLSPSPPLRRKSFPNSVTIPVDPPSPPTRRPSICALSNSCCSSHGNEHVVADEDDSTLDTSERKSLDASDRSIESLASLSEGPVRSPSWYPLLSDDMDKNTPPVMPKHQLSQSTLDLSNCSLSCDCSSRWESDAHIPPPPLSE